MLHSLTMAIHPQPESQVVQWLGFGALTAAAGVRFPVWEGKFFLSIVHLVNGIICGLFKSFGCKENSLNRGSVNNIFVKFKMFVSYWHCNVLEHNSIQCMKKTPHQGICPCITNLTETCCFLHLIRIQTLSKIFSRAWFRSTDLWVMGPARFHCATLLQQHQCFVPAYVFQIWQQQFEMNH